MHFQSLILNSLKIFDTFVFKLKNSKPLPLIDFFQIKDSQIFIFNLKYLNQINVIACNLN